MHDPETIESQQTQEILDIKYSPAALEDIAAECLHLTSYKQSQLLKLLTKYAELFDGTLGKWQTQHVELELKEGVEPYHARPFSVPHSQEQKLKDKINQLVKLKILHKKDRSEHAAPMFTIPKKDGSIRSITDFRELNNKIKWKPFPLPKIQDILQKLEGFMYATTLDLNMGYYHIELSSTASSYCTVVLLWGKYKYLQLPMGLCNSPDIFQENMSKLMEDLELARVYIDNLLVLSNQNFSDHLEKLEEVLTQLQGVGLKVKVSKSCFAHVEYLGYWITSEGIKPLNKKVEAINNLCPLKTH